MKFHPGWSVRRVVAAVGMMLSAAGVASAADDVPALPGQPAAVEEPPPAGERNQVNAFVPMGVPIFDRPAAPVGVQVNMSGFTREYRPVPIDATEADIAIRAALDGRIEDAWDFREASLREVVGRLSEALRVAVLLDERALDDAGIDTDAPVVTARFTGMTARAALRVLLTPLDLTFVVADETLAVTTREQAQQRLTPVAYPLPRWAGAEGDPAAEQVIDVIQSTVAIETWDTIGGPGSIRVIEAAGEPLLVVNQTADVHDALERLLRAIHGRALAEFEGGARVLKVHRVDDARAREDLAQRLKDLCNETLGVDADQAAEITAVAATLAVRSKSPRFHAMAAQVIAAVAGPRRPPQPEAPAPMGGGGGVGGP